MSSQAVRPISAIPTIGPTTAPAIHALLSLLFVCSGGMLFGMTADEGSDVGVDPEGVIR